MKWRPRWDRFLFDEALELLAPKSIVVEIGAIRNPHPNAARADGHSTLRWVASGHKTWCVDSDPKAIEITKRLAGDEACNYVVSDGIEFLKEFHGEIDLLYLDGPHPNSGGAEFCRDAITVAGPKFSRHAAVLIDDCDLSPSKGEMSIELLVKLGFTLIRRDRQMLWARRRDFCTGTTKICGSMDQQNER